MERFTSKSKKLPLYFKKWNFLALILRNFLYFRKRKHQKKFVIFKEMKLFIFWKMESRKNYLYFRILNQTILLIYKNIENFLVLNLFLAFRYFSLYVFIIISLYKFNIISFILLYFPKLSYIYPKIFSFFIMKYIHFVLSECLLCILISGKNMHKCLIFIIIFVTNEIFKIFFTKRKLII